MFDPRTGHLGRSIWVAYGRFRAENHIVLWVTFLMSSCSTKKAKSFGVAKAIHRPTVEVKPGLS